MLGNAPVGSPYTMIRYGCGLHSLMNTCEQISNKRYTPVEVNDWMKVNGGFGTNSSDILWVKAYTLYGIDLKGTRLWPFTRFDANIIIRRLTEKNLGTVIKFKFNLQTKRAHYVYVYGSDKDNTRLLIKNPSHYNSSDTHIILEDDKWWVGDNKWVVEGGNYNSAFPDLMIIEEGWETIF